MLPVFSRIPGSFFPFSTPWIPVFRKPASANPRAADQRQRPAEAGKPSAEDVAERRRGRARRGVLAVQDEASERIRTADRSPTSIRSPCPAVLRLVLAGFLVAGVLLHALQLAPLWHANGTSLPTTTPSAAPRPNQSTASKPRTPARAPVSPSPRGKHNTASGREPGEPGEAMRQDPTGCPALRDRAARLNPMRERRAVADERHIGIIIAAAQHQVGLDSCVRLQCM